MNTKLHKGTTMDGLSLYATKDTTYLFRSRLKMIKLERELKFRQKKARQIEMAREHGASSSARFDLPAAIRASLLYPFRLEDTGLRGIQYRT